MRSARHGLSWDYHFCFANWVMYTSATRHTMFQPSFNASFSQRRSRGQDKLRDEESLFFLASCAERFLASFGMKAGIAFFRKLFRRRRSEFQVAKRALQTHWFSC